MCQLDPPEQRNTFPGRREFFRGADTLQSAMTHGFDVSIAPLDSHLADPSDIPGLVRPKIAQQLKLRHVFDSFDSNAHLQVVRKSNQRADECKGLR